MGVKLLDPALSQYRSKGGSQIWQVDKLGLASGNKMISGYGRILLQFGKKIRNRRGLSESSIRQNKLRLRSHPPRMPG